MAESRWNLLCPKKKRKVRASRHAPLPVPIRSITLDTENTGKWLYYSGHLMGSTVMVSLSGDLWYLYNMGFFGRGNLSRGGLNYSCSFPRSSSAHPGFKSLRVIKRQSYIRHLNWQREQEIGQSAVPSEDLMFISEYDSSQEHGETGTWEQGVQDCHMQDIKDSQNHDEINEDVPVKEGMQNDWTGAEGIDSDWTKIEGTKNNWLYRSTDWSSSVERGKTDLAEALWNSQEADVDFWLSDNVPKPKEKDLWGDNAEVDHDFWSTEPKKAAVYHTDTTTTCTKESEWSNSEVDRSFCSDSAVKHDKHPKRTRIDSKADESASDLCHVESNVGKKMSESIGEIHDTRTRETTLVEDKSCYNTCSSDGKSEAYTGGGNNCASCDTWKTMGYKSTTPNVNMANIPHGNAVFPETGSTGVENAGLVVDGHVKPVDPLCGEDEETGDVLVVSDSDDDGRGVSMWKRVVKHDPYMMRENLQLSLEEAFFLSYGLGCLVCLNHCQERMNLCKMWQTFYGLRKNFVPNYIAYHHFRSKGWVPKPGIKYGTDFILYKEGPPFYHATYSVVVRMVDHLTLRDDPAYISKYLTWTSLSGLNRITENVAKEVLFCFIIPPSGTESANFSSPKCIPHFKVQEMVLKRWVPAQERESKVREDIP